MRRILLVLFATWMLGVGCNGDRMSTRPDDRPVSPRIVASIGVGTPETNLTGDAGDQREAVTSGDIVAWVDQRDGNREIYACDISGGLDTCSPVNLTNDPADQWQPTIAGSLVAWTDLSGAADIKGCDVSGGLTQGCGGSVIDFTGAIPPTLAREARPALTDRHLFWLGSDGSLGGQGGLFGCDLSLGAGACAANAVPLSTASTVPDGLSSLGVSNNFVAWKSDTIGEIVGCDISGGLVTCATDIVILSNASNGAINPVVSGNTIIWWQFIAAGTHEVVGCDLSGGIHSCSPVSLTDASQRDIGEPDLNGTVVVWERTDNAGIVEGCDIALGPAACLNTVFTVVDKSSLPEPDKLAQRAAVARNTVVWQDRRTGDWEIFGVQLTGVTPPSPPGPPPPPPPQDNQPPVATACAVVEEGPRPLPCLNPQTSTIGPLPRPITLVASNSTDPEGEALTFTWLENGTALGSDEVLPITLPPGHHIITLVVSDGEHSRSDHVAVTVFKDVVVLVHGVISDPAGAFDQAATLLTNDNFLVYSYDYSQLTSWLDVSTSIERLALDFGLALKGQGPRPIPPEFRGSRDRPVSVVGHSMGGLVTRTYMTGLAEGGLGYDGEIKKLILLGTPNYGAPLAVWDLVAAQILDQEVTQLAEMRLGSDLIWRLSVAWAITQPLPREAVLGVAGYVDHHAACVEPGLRTDGDGVVSAVSAALPPAAMQTVLYVPFKHFGGLTFLFLEFLTDCPLASIAAINDASHDTFEAIRAFLTDQPLPSPLDPRPTTIRDFGLVVLRLENQDGSVIVPSVSVDDFVFLRRGRIAKCPRSSRQSSAILTAPARISPLLCQENADGATVTFGDVPSGRWTLNATLSDGRFASATVEVHPGRPTAVLLQF